MADVLVSALLSVLIKKATDQVHRQFGVMWGITGKLEELERKLLRIQRKIGNAEERQGEDDVKLWLEALKERAYEAEDILDEFNVDVMRLKSAGNMKEKVRSFFSSYNPVLFRFQIGRKLNYIIQKINTIVTEEHQFNFTDTTIQPQNRPDRPQTHSYVDESTVIGREEEKKKIVELLLHRDNNQNVAILPIVGMGGLGKTTLAQLVYKDKRVEKHFEPLIWVCVSEEFELVKLAKAIITSAEKKECHDSTMDLLQHRLRQVLSGKRYFLVLDDVCNDDSEKWNGLKTLLETGKEGSKIIVTTRSDQVARIMGTIPTHYPQQLNEDDSWTLFKKRAFKDGAEEPQNLVSIGKDIVKKCDGLPLAVNVMGALMHSKSQEAEWLSVKNREIWNLEGSDKILSVLRLSYSDLPSHIKQCFAFCAIFPMDHVMHKKTLIELWMANGFIPSDEGKELEDKGNEIFNELVWRSFFQDIKEDLDYDYRTTCKMHDLMHDLAQSIMGNECPSNLVHFRWEHISKKTRHLYIPPESQLDTQRTINNFPNIRTLLIPHECSGIVVTGDSLKSMPLRACQAQFRNGRQVINAIRFLKHLRYLDLSLTAIEALPEATSTLFNLQTLRLFGCWRLRKLPDGMKNMSNLRHLCFNGCSELKYMPTSMGQLRTLRTLSKYFVGNEDGRRIDELNGLNLGGQLELYNLRNVKNIADAKEANLNSKHNLCSLLLCWDMTEWYLNVDHGEEVASVKNAEEVLEGLRPHVGLKKLIIFRYGGNSFPMWIKDSQLLQNLVDIRLEFCTGCEHLPPLWQARSLKYLHLKNMDKVKHICSGNESNGTVQAFPLLKRLELRKMQSLEAWLEDEGTAEVTLVFPCLADLDIIDCPNLMSMPELPSLESLFMAGTHIPLGFLKNLASLQRLSIVRCDDLVYWPEQEFRGLNSLKNLYIRDCKNLIGPSPSPSSSSSSGDGELLPNLEELKISKCDGLLKLPKLPTSLISFDVSCCPNLSSLTEGGLQHVTALKSLCMAEMHIPLGFLNNLASLQTLGIVRCDDLIYWPEEEFRGLNSLKNLYINFCKNLIGPSPSPSSSSSSWDGELLPNLEELTISGCDGLLKLPKLPTSLISFNVSRCPNLSSLTEGGLQYVTALESLYIGNCISLTSLPEDLSPLTALQRLQIINCVRLPSLPEGLQQRLPHIQSPIIRGCPNLERWYNISAKLDSEEASERSSYRTFLPSFCCFRRASTV